MIWYYVALVIMGVIVIAVLLILKKKTFLKLVKINMALLAAFPVVSIYTSIVVGLAITAALAVFLGFIFPLRDEKGEESHQSEDEYDTPLVGAGYGQGPQPISSNMSAQGSLNANHDLGGAGNMGLYNNIQDAAEPVMPFSPISNVNSPFGANQANAGAFESAKPQMPTASAQPQVPTLGGQTSAVGQNAGFTEMGSTAVNAPAHSGLSGSMPLGNTPQGPPIQASGTGMPLSPLARAILDEFHNTTSSSPSVGNEAINSQQNQQSMESPLAPEVTNLGFSTFTSEDNGVPRTVGTQAAGLQMAMDNSMPKTVEPESMQIGSETLELGVMDTQQAGGSTEAEMLDFGVANMQMPESNIGPGTLDIGAGNIGPGTLDIGAGNMGSGTLDIGAGNMGSGRLDIGAGNMGSGTLDIGAGNMGPGTLDIGADSIGPGTLDIGAGMGSGTLDIGADSIGPGTLDIGANNIGPGTLDIGADNIGPGTLDIGADNIGPGTLDIGTGNIGPETLDIGASNIGPETLDVGTANIEPETLESGVTDMRPESIAPDAMGFGGLEFAHNEISNESFDSVDGVMQLGNQEPDSAGTNNELMNERQDYTNDQIQQAPPIYTNDQSQQAPPIYTNDQSQQPPSIYSNEQPQHVPKIYSNEQSQPVAMYSNEQSQPIPTTSSNEQIQLVSPTKSYLESLQKHGIYIDNGMTMSEFLSDSNKAGSLSWLTNIVTASPDDTSCEMETLLRKLCLDSDDPFLSNMLLYTIQSIRRKRGLEPDHQLVRELIAKEKSMLDKFAKTSSASGA